MMPAEHYVSLAAVEKYYWWHLSRLDRAERLLRKFANPSELRVLDFGCGTGGFMEILHARCGFRSATGCDISEQGISRCPRCDVSYRLIPPGDYSLVGQSDVVFLMDVLEHVSDDGTMLQAIHDRLPTGAFVLLSAPAHESLLSMWDQALGHYRRYSRLGLAAMAEGAGFEVLRVEYAFALAALGISLRKLGLFRRSDEYLEFPPVPVLLNAALRRINAAEAAVADIFPIPFGGSIFALVRKR